MRKQLTKKVRDQLEEAVTAWAEAEPVATEAANRVNAAKAVIQAIVDEYELPIQEGKTEWYNSLKAGRAVSVTHGEFQPTVDGEQLLANIGAWLVQTGVEPEVAKVKAYSLFHQVVTVKAVEFHEDAFIRAVDFELLSDKVLTGSNLLPSAIAQRPPPSPAKRLTSLKEAK